METELHPVKPTPIVPDQFWCWQCDQPIEVPDFEEKCRAVEHLGLTPDITCSICLKSIGIPARSKRNWSYWPLLLLFMDGFRDHRHTWESYPTKLVRKEYTEPITPGAYHLLIPIMVFLSFMVLLGIWESLTWLL